jgi:hypothetical protein
LDCFALFPDYIARFQAADPQNFAAIQVQNGIFKAAFFAPAGLLKEGWQATKSMWYLLHGH